MRQPQCCWPLKFRHIAAFRQRNPYGTAFAFDQVKSLQGATQPPRLHANDGVKRGIKAITSAEYDRGDVVRLYAVPSAHQGFLDDVFEESTISFRRFEMNGVQDAAQLEANVF